MNLNFNDLEKPFTYKQKLESFLSLQKFLLDKVNKNEPFFVGRLPGQEATLCGNILNNINIFKTNPRLLFYLLTGAGIQFHNETDVYLYVQMLHKSCLNSQQLAIWSGGPYAQAKLYYDIIEKMYPKERCICAQALEPFYFMEEDNYNFSKIFKNKKVLIITSHSETTKNQLNKPNKYFKKNIFDESTKFYVYKPAQQNAGNHDANSWQFHYNKMKLDLNKLVGEFDIALVSCGGFGMILCDYIFTELKKSAMYIGGPLQLYFGIIGNRWRHHPVISKLFNDNWITVMDQDKPPGLIKNATLCENSCYW